MCGIAGCALRDSGRTPAAEDLARMVRELRHRGPDGERIVVGPGGGLAMRRLRIIDLDPTADPPMESEDSGVLAVLNGEIYDHAALRGWLAGRGHVFRTRTDTEVLPHLYEETGPTEDLVRRLRGMYALAVWDRRRQILLLARDPIGKKPLYVHEGGAGVYFASELPALLAVPAIRASARIDRGAVAPYLRLGYVPTPQTAVAGIERVPPGYLLVVREGRIAERIRTFRPFGPPRPEGALSALREVAARLDDACRIRLEADVPVGVLLSGGIDSSLVAASAARASRSPIRTFTFDFDEPAFSEGRHGEAVARRIGSIHRTIRLAEDPARAALEVLGRLGEPFADSSAVPTYLLARAARREVSVVLTGDGGDEIFGGYDRYRAHLLLPLLRDGLLLPASLLGLAGRALARPASRASRLLEAAGDGPVAAHARWLALADASVRDAVLAPDLAGKGEGAAGGCPAIEESGPPALHGIMAWDLHAYLPEDVLWKVDRMTMAHGLEARSPFLDRGLVTYAARLPPRLKVRPFRTKVLLRRLFRRRFPGLAWARPKQGFGAPVASWLRGPLAGPLREILCAPDLRSRDVLDARAVARFVAEHTAGARDHHALLWAILALEIFRRTWRL